MLLKLHCEHMKERLLAIESQTSYAGERRESMPEGALLETPRGIEEVTVTNGEKKELGKEKGVVRKILAGIKKFIEGMLKREKEKEERKARAEREKVPVQRLSDEKLKEYFTKTPKDPEVRATAEDFVDAAGGKPLSLIDTENLVAHYLVLQKLAKQKGEDPSFLENLEKALESARHKVSDVNTLVKAGEKQLSARRAWNEWEKKLGRPLTEAQQRIRERFVAQGKDPRVFQGAQEQPQRQEEETQLPNISDVSDETLGKIVHDANRREQRERQDAEFIRGQISRVYKFLDELKSEPDEQRRRELRTQGQQLLAGFEGWQRLVRQHEESLRREREEEEQLRGGFYGERRLTPEDRRQIQDDIENLVQKRPGAGDAIERFFNRMFYRADVRSSDPFQEAFGTAGSIEYDEFIKTLGRFREEIEDQTRRDLIARLIDRYSKEYKLRQLLHNANYIAESGGEFQDFVGYARQFVAEYADITFLESPEVEVALRIREQVLYQIKTEDPLGNIPYERVMYDPKREPEDRVSEYEQRTRMMLRNLNRAGIFGDPLDEWKLDRALSLSRGFGIITLRLPEIISECPLSKNPDAYESQRSIPWETITWELNFLDHKMKRYSIGRRLRAIIFFNYKKKYPWWKPWSQEELKKMLAYDTVTALAQAEGVERGVDMRNLFKIGSPLSHTGWRIYTSSLNRELTDLEPLLRQNPGLAVRVLFNRYEKSDLAQYKQQFLKDYKQNHPFADSNEVLSAWNKREEEIKKKGITAEELEIREPEKKGRVWEAADMKAWENAAKRIPHVVLRIITDPANRLMSEQQRQILLRDVFQTDLDLAGGDFKLLWKQTMDNLTLAKESMFKRRRDWLNLTDAQRRNQPFGEDKDILTNDDFALIQDQVRIGQAKRLRDCMEDMFTKEVTGRERHLRYEDYEGLRERIFKKTENREFPFAVTAEDVPWGEFRFSQTGGRGFITRKMNDNLQDKLAQDAVIELLVNLRMYNSPEEIVNQLNKIFQAASIHDPDRAQDAVQFLAKGIIRLYQKDGVLKIPIFGEAMGLVNAIAHRGNSFAQTEFGMKAAAWDSDDIYNFTEQLRQILTYDQISKLREETGGTFIKAFAERFKVGFYLLFIILLYESIERVIKEK